MREHAQELVSGQRNGKYSPVDVAQWLEDRAEAAENLHGVKPGRESIDARMLAGLGRFFAAKFRAGVLYGVYELTGDPRALFAAREFYARAEGIWSGIAYAAKGVYAADLSVSDRFDERGQWADRKWGITADIAQLLPRRGSQSQPDDERATAAIADVRTPSKRSSRACRHAPPHGFRRGEAATIAMGVPNVESVRLYYRHVNQAERYQVVAMDAQGETYLAQIPATYTDSPYPLQYYFELRMSPKDAWLYPGLGRDLMDQPYFVLRSIMTAA
jgi:hypothetical protein